MNRQSTRAVTALLMAAVTLLAPRLPSLAQGAAGTGKLIKNGDFDRNTDGWSRWFAPRQAEGDGQWVARDDGGAMKVTVLRREQRSSVQIFQGPFAVKKGAWYCVSLEARGETEAAMRVSLMRHNPPYGNLGLSAEVPLGTQWERFTLLAQAVEDSEDARVDFFPPVSFWLDSVSVRPLGETPSSWPVRQVLPGPGWEGEPASLTDGDERTFVHSRRHPVRPLLLTLDLGEPRPVGAAIVRGEDRGRHVATYGLAVEVSADGKSWLHWARGARTSVGDAVRKRTTFVCTNLAVLARYLRVRITSLKGAAWLSEARVIAADTAPRTALNLLRVVAPEEDLAFQGWDYDQLGYAASPGERVALRFSNQGNRAVENSLRWRLETYAGDEISRGEGGLQVAPQGREIVDVPIELPADLVDGPHRLRFRIGEDGPEDAFYFDYRIAQADPALGLRLVALLDNVDPEGWVKLIAGPVAPFVDVRAALPEDPQSVDAVLVMAERWPPEGAQVGELDRYLSAGGVAVFYGKVSPSLAEMLPVKIDYEDPWITKPQRLEPPSFWPDFQPGEGPRHYGVRVQAKPDAGVLARWEDGSAAIVEGSYASGRTLYVGAGPGRVWQRRPGLEGTDELTLRALYYLLGRRNAAGALARLRESVVADRDQRRQQVIAEVASDKAASAAVGMSAGNVGRFGWAIQEGGLTENLSADAQIACPAAPRVASRLDIPGRGPFMGRPSSLNWFSKTVEWSDEQGVVLTSTMSVGAPCILWEGEAERLDITGGASHVAIPTANGVRVLASGADIAGTEMSANWLVLFRADENERDVPRLVILTRRPTRVGLGDALELSFDGRGFGALFTGRLYGLRRFGLGETAGWVNGFPAEVATQARALGAQCLAYPVACQEVYWPDGDAVTIANLFDFRVFRDDWNTPARRLAPIPPVVSLARVHGFPVQIEGEIEATGVATKYGPLEGVEGDRLRYRLPLPPLDHFGVIPVEGRMDLAEIIDHYAIEGIESCTRASGGLTTASAFLADLRRYMAAGSVPPFEAACLDLYKWWYCFPNILGRPALGPEARPQIDAHYRERYWRTLNYYPHKGLVRYRREPWTGLPYTITFIWPVHFRDGVRYFVDENEAACVILYCLEAYSRYYGDWVTPASNWNLARYLHSYLGRFHDWAVMASSNQEYFGTVGIDMLNSEYPGNLAFARLAHQVGDVESEGLGLYLAAKAIVPTIARHFMPDYVKSITADGDPWREARYYWRFSETGLQGDTDIIGRGKPDAIYAIANGFLDTSKGTSPEIALLYKVFARERMDAYERAVERAVREHEVAAGWAHLMQRAFLRWPREELIAAAERFYAFRPHWGWQSTKGAGNLAALCVADTPLFLADWAPAEYVAGSFTPADRTVRLTFNSREAGPYSVRLYSRWPASEVTLNGVRFEGWEYQPDAGWLTLTCLGPGESKLEIRLEEGPLAPLHAYFAE